MDEINQKILTMLQENAKTTYAELAKATGMAPSGVMDRIRRLERRGYIAGYTTILKPSKLNLNLLAFVAVKTPNNWSDNAAKAMAALPNVLEVHEITGEDAYLLKIRSTGTEHLSYIIKNQLGAIEEVVSTQSTIVLNSLKETSILPVEQG
ncbi:Lrp/AsnC family transcriptional regulator [Thermoproteota archaeon]